MERHRLRRSSRGSYFIWYDFRKREGSPVSRPAFTFPPQCIPLFLPSRYPYEKDGEVVLLERKLLSLKVVGVRPSAGFPFQFPPSLPRPGDHRDQTISLAMKINVLHFELTTWAYILHLLGLKVVWCSFFLPLLSEQEQTHQAQSMNGRLVGNLICSWEHNNLVLIYLD